MDISFSGKFPFTSARTSIGQEETICFYSVPTSPSFKVNTSTSLSGFQTEATTPRTYEDANSSFDEFEFETSRRFNLSDLENERTPEEEEDDDDDERQKQRSPRQRGDSMPTMAFADELFSDGKVLPLGPPLKLPPRLQNGSGKEKSSPSSAASLSSRSPGSASLWFPFVHQSLWNDDFDPFMVALEVVKEEEEEEGRGKSKGRGHGIRRTRSLSPFRGKSPNRPSRDQCGPVEEVCENQEAQTSRSPKLQPCDPKGLVSARTVRLIGVGKNGPVKPKRGKEESESGEAWTRKRKREKILRLLFGKASAEQHKFKDQNAEMGKFGFLNKLGLDKDENHGRVSEMKKMTLTCYKPRLLLCLDYGGRYVK